MITVVNDEDEEEVELNREADQGGLHVALWRSCSHVNVSFRPMAKIRTRFN